MDMDGTLCNSMVLWRKETEMIEDFRNREVLEPAFDRMREHYRERVQVKDGVLEFLRNAKKNGVKMCIASGTRRDVAEPFLARSGLMEFMEFYIDCFDVHAFKERPDIYLEAARRLGGEIEECAVFEDAEYCAATAKKAGFFVVGIYDDVAASEGEPQKFCDVFVKDWRELSDKALLKN